MAQRAIMMTRDLAYCLGFDYANRQMRKAGRKTWNEDDYNLAVRTQVKAYPLEAEYPWASPEQIAEMKRQLGYD